MANHRAVRALKLYYLAAYLGIGALLPLLALTMAARGFDPLEFRWVLVLLPLARLLSPPLWGALADSRLGSTRLLRINSWFATAALVALVPPAGFGTTLCLFGIWALFTSSLMPLAEASTYRALEGRAENFSYIRVWGSVGFAVTAALMGAIGLGEGARLPFAIAAGFFAVSALVASGLPDARGEMRAPLFRSVHGLAKKPDVLLLWGASALYYAAHGTFDSYIGPHLEQIPGVGLGIVSYTWALGVVAEVIALFYVPPLLRRFGASRLLVFAGVVSALRWFLLAHATSALHVWLLAPTHAVTYGVWYLAFVHDNQERAPKELRATVQGLAAACLSLGNMAAILVGGRVLSQFGGRLLFECAAVLALCATGLYVVRGRLLARMPRAVAGEVERA